MTTALELDEDLAYVTLIGDGTSKKHFGNFIGLFGIPPRGGLFWYAENGDYGYCETKAEAIKEIEDARFIRSR